MKSLQRHVNYTLIIMKVWPAATWTRFSLNSRQGYVLTLSSYCVPLNEGSRGNGNPLPGAVNKSTAHHLKNRLMSWPSTVTTEPITRSVWCTVKFKRMLGNQPRDICTTKSQSFVGWYSRNAFFVILYPSVTSMFFYFGNNISYTEVIYN